MAYHYALFRTHWVTFQAKNSVRSTLGSTAQVHTEATTRILQKVTYVVVKKGMEHKGKQRTMMQALELLWLTKRLSWNKAMEK